MKRLINFSRFIYFKDMPKYNNIDNIPAKVFFDILKSKDYQQLKPKPTEKDLEQVFIDIYDDFFIKSDNAEAKRYLELTNEIAFLKYKIASLKQSLHFYYYNQTTKEMRLDFIDALKTGFGIEIDFNLPFIDEVQRVLSIEIGVIQNDLSLLEIDYKEMIEKSKGKDFNYFENLVGIGNVLQGNSLVKEEMTLAVYIECEKLASRITNEKSKK